MKDYIKEKSTMEYVLMHKNIPVTELEIDSITGYILKVNNTENPKHLPMGIGFTKILLTGRHLMSGGATVQFLQAVQV